MQSIKNIIFDLGGVLIDIEKEACLKSFQEITQAPLNQFFDDSSVPNFFLEFERGNLSRKEFYFEIRKRVNVPNLSDESIDKLWLTFLKTIVPEKLELLLQLKKKYHLFLLSNTNPIHWDEICSRYFVTSNHNLNDYFNSIYLSYQMNLIKPDRKIFERVLSDANINSSESLFIDDSSVNCEAAKSVGLVTFLSKNGKDWMNLFLSNSYNGNIL